MRVWDQSHHGSWHLYGHSHGKLPDLGLSTDVGVDGHNFQPWSFEEVRAYFRSKT
jgi:calcineurin-like phosphoesterase family protein